MDLEGHETFLPGELGHCPKPRSNRPTGQNRSDRSMRQGAERLLIVSSKMWKSCCFVRSGPSLWEQQIESAPTSRLVLDHRCPQKSVCECDLEPELASHMLAANIQSRSSSPSSDPPGPPRTFLKSFGCHSVPDCCLWAANSLCRSSIFVFSSVAASWFCSLIATTVLCQSFCDSPSSCSSSGRTFGGVCLAWVASNKTSFFPVYGS